MAAGKITDIVDDRAFKQLEQLLIELNIAQAGFLKTTETVEGLNRAIGKTSNLKDLSSQVVELQKANTAMEAAAAKQQAAAAKAVKAENDLVRATKERIIVTDTEIKSLNKYTNSVDVTVKIQARLKAELAALKKEQNAAAKEFENGAITADAYSTILGNTAKRELELKDALKTATDNIKRQREEKEKAVKIAEILARSEKLEAEALKEKNITRKEDVVVTGIVNERSSEYVRHTEESTKAQKDAAAATSQKVTAVKEERSVLDMVSGSLDENIRLQIRLKAELAEVRAEQKRVNQDLAEGGNAKASATEKTVELTKRELELKAAIQETNTDIRRIVKEVNAVEGSYKQLDAQLNRLRDAYRSLNDEEKANADIGGVLKASIDELDEELKKQDASLGVFNRNVGNYQSALSQFPGVIGEIAGGFDTLVNSVDNVNDSVQNSPGMFTQFTTGLQTMAKAAWAFVATPVGATLAAISAGLLAARGWFEYNKNLVEATRLTKQLTDMEGAELKNFRSEVQATADVFEKDFKEVLTATNAVAKQFGISHAEALDIINKGFVAGADASGDYLEQLKEYPTQLRAVGLSAEETTAIIAQNVKEGIFSDKGIDAIKEAGIRIREMTPATQKAIDGIGLSSKEIQKGLEDGTVSMFEVIQQVSDKLGELPENSAAVGTAIADIFGGAGEDAGLAYIKTLSTIDTDLDNLVDGMGEVGAAQLKQLEATEELNKAWAALFDSTGGAFEMLIANAKLFGTNILLGIINGVIDLTNYFIELYNESALVRGIFQLIGVTFKNSFDVIAFSIRQTLTSVKTLGQAFAAVLKGNFSEAGDIVKEGLAEAWGNAKELGNDIAENYIEGINATLRGGKIEKIELPTGVGGGASAETVTNNVLGKQPTEEELKVYAEKIKRIQEAEIALHQSRLERSRDRAKTVVDDNQLPYEDRLSNLEQYLAREEELINLNREKELSNKELTSYDIMRIEEETQEELIRLKSEGARLSESILKDQLSNEEKLRVESRQKELNDIEKSRDEQLLALNSRFASGQIESEKDYANERLRIQQDFTRQYVNAEIEALEEIIKLNKAKGLDVSEQEKQIAALRLRLSQETTDKQIENIAKVKAEEEELNSLRKELGNEIFELGTQLISQRFDAELNALDKQSEKIEENKQRELDRINSTVTNEEEKAKRIAIVEAKAQADREALEDRQRQIETERARFEKAAMIAKIIGETAIKVIEYGIFTPQAALAGAIGATLLAKVVSTKIPEYSTGVESSGEGLAIVGEKGSELRIEPTGEMSLTGDKPELTWLREGTKIVPAHNVQQYLFNNSITSSGSSGNGTEEWREVLKALKEGNRNLAGALRSRVNHNTVLSRSGLSHSYKTNTAYKKYINRNFS